MPDSRASKLPGTNRYRSVKWSRTHTLSPVSCDSADDHCTACLLCAFRSNGQALTFTPASVEASPRWRRNVITTRVAGMYVLMSHSY